MKRFLAFCRGVAVDLGVVPAVAGVRLICIIEDEPSVMEEAEPLGGLSVVLVGLGRAVRKLVLAVIESKGIGKLHELLLGEHLLDLAPEGLIHAVVVVRINEAAVLQTGPQPLDLEVGERDVPMPGRENERIGEEPVIRNFDELVGGFHIDQGMLPDERQQVHFLLLVVVPIAAARIFQARDFEGAGKLRLLRQNAGGNKKNEHNDEDESGFHALIIYQFEEREATSQILRWCFNLTERLSTSSC